MRNTWTTRFHWLSPAVNMQDVLAHIAETDLNTFLRFQYALANFHEDITDFYFLRLFWDKPISREDYEQLPTFDMPLSDNRWSIIWLGLGKVSLAAVFVFILGFRVFNQD